MTLDQSVQSQMNKVLAALDAVVRQEGSDYVYPKSPKGSCEYVRINPQTELPEASCLAGRVLHKLGVPVADLAAWEGKACDRLETLHGPAVDGPLGNVALHVLRQAQRAQDNGKTWGAARDVAQAAWEAIYWSANQGSLT